MRVTFVLASLAGGGAERVCAMMANYWVEHGIDVTLITLSASSTDFYSLDTRVERIGLNALAFSGNFLHAARNNIRRLYALRQAIRYSQPDTVISFVEKTNILTLICTRGLGLYLIVAERIDPSAYKIGKIWSSLRRLSYPQANIVVVQSEKVQRWFMQIVEPTKLRVIPNPVTPPKYLAVYAPTIPFPEGRVIIAMGRLDVQKGFDLLIHAFAQNAELYPSWNLAILGEGVERVHLEALVSQLGLTERVNLPGVIKNPEAILQQADLFVLSSRFEGFPNALLEAMACGLPVVSFDCPSGPRHIIRHDQDGILVPPEDISALAQAMQSLMADERKRKRLGTNALNVLDRFGLEAVMQLWDSILRPIRVNDVVGS